jgi:hypothetical protein
MAAGCKQKMAEGLMTIVRNLTNLLWLLDVNKEAILNF